MTWMLLGWVRLRWPISDAAAAASLRTSGRSGDALGEPGRAERLARKQAVEHRAAADLVVVVEQEARLLEQALLARGLQVGDDVTRGQDFGDETHVRFSYSLSL